MNENKMKMKTIRGRLANALAIAAFIGGMMFMPAMTCKNQTARFEPGGAYTRINDAGQLAVDFPLFYADSAFETAQKSLDFAFKFERDNRNMLWAINPDIKHGLDKLRPEAALLVRKYDVARKAYTANPGDGSLATIEDVAKQLQKLAAAALAVVETKGQP